jgi:hypothetical protein
MLSQLQTIVKKLSLASLQTEKTKDKDSSPKRPVKDKARSAKGKAKSAKDKNIPASTSCCYYKGHITDTKSSSKDEVEVATFC